MAKRKGGGTRRSRDAHLDDDDDDEFAWQSPKTKKKKKKKKKKKSTGSTKSASTRSSARSSTGKRKRSSTNSSSSISKKKKKKKTRTSGRRSSAGDSWDDDDMDSSSRRRRAAPAKKGVDPIIPISLISITVILFVGVLIYSMNKKEPEVRDEQKLVDKAKEQIEDANKAYDAWARARNQGKQGEADRLHGEAISKFRQAQTTLNDALQPHRIKSGPDEGMLPPEYEGYEKYEQEINEKLYDLQKGASTGGH